MWIYGISPFVGVVRLTFSPLIGPGSVRTACGGGGYKPGENGVGSVVHFIGVDGVDAVSFVAQEDSGGGTGDGSETS